MIRAVLVALVASLLLALPAGSTDAATRVTLRLDGVSFRPEVALTSDQRAVGLMNRRRAPKDGMLFVFPEPTSSGFWMKNTLVPLSIVFFNADGTRVRRLVMQPCKTDSCPIYVPGRRYRFALELPAADRRPAKRLGPHAALGRLVRRAS